MANVGKYTSQMDCLGLQNEAFGRHTYKVGPKSPVISRVMFFTPLLGVMTLLTHF